MKKFGTIVRRIIFIAAFCVFVFSAYKLYEYFSDAAANRKFVNGLIDGAVTQNEGDAGDDELICPIEVDFDELWQTNADIVAWLYCEDTVINYPVAQGEDNEYYLHIRADGVYSRAGTIFLDFRNSSGFSDLNSVVYGHNMKNDTMFGTLTDYNSQSYYDEHPIMWLVTPEQSYVVELFAGFVTPSDSDSYDIIYDYDDLEAYIEEIMPKSTFTSSVDVSGIEKIVTLSTCSYEYNNARYVLLGSLRPCE